jgi:uncharacterized membrane protein
MEVQEINIEHPDNLLRVNALGVLINIQKLVLYIITTAFIPNIASLKLNISTSIYPYLTNLISNSKLYKHEQLFKLYKYKYRDK